VDAMKKEQFDQLKIESVVLYIVNKLPVTTFHTLSKILFFADQKHLSLYGRKVVNDTYHRLVDGPVPSFIYDALKSVRDGDKVFNYTSLLIDSIEVKGKCRILPKKLPDLDLLSETDIECLDKSIEENGDLDWPKLRDKSHGHAWNSVSMNQPINDLDIAIEADSAEWIVKLIQERKEIELMY
jgi:uncharacterized phage-associated protein